MRQILNISNGLRRTSISNYVDLINRSFALKSLDFGKSAHAHLIKLGLNGYTYLGNRVIDFYVRFGDDVDGVVRAFQDVLIKNTVSCNIGLKGLVNFGEMARARKMFDEMPTRDVVSWNTMVKGYAACGRRYEAWRVFMGMQGCGVKPSSFTLSILVKVVSCVRRGKEIHAYMVRNAGFWGNVVIGNALIDMYGMLGMTDYAYGVFLSMEVLDVISWNSIMFCSHKTGFEQLALDVFCSISSSGFAPDEFTVSTVIAVCANLEDLEKGKQVFALCTKKGFLSNSIVASASIDLFSRCNRFEESVGIFRDLDRWDSAVCNSMIASFTREGLPGDAFYLFILASRENIYPTEFTLSTMISSAIDMIPSIPGIQLHSFTEKLGFMSDAVVASSLVDMYAKYGMIESSLSVFCDIIEKDLLCWNVMIMGLAENGRGIEALSIYDQMRDLGQRPDDITFAGLLSACKHAGFAHEGVDQFSKMVKENVILPRVDHYECLIDLLCQAGLFEEALDICGRMPHEPTALIWRSILPACKDDLQLIESVSYRLMEMEAHSSLPHLVLAQAYEKSGRWESMVRVKRSMAEKGIAAVIGWSWLVMTSHGFIFRSDELVHYGGEDIYLVLSLLSFEMEDDEYIYEQFLEEE